jgi:hypothetical protein
MITKIVISPENTKVTKVLAELTARKEAIRVKIEKKLIERKMIPQK